MPRFRRRAQPSSDLPQVDGFDDLRLIGSGGFSKVYTAYEERFARTVALKVVGTELHGDAARRFEREQRAAGQLDGHPNVIRVYQSGLTADGRPYLAMEYLAQGSMADRLRRHGPLPPAEVLDIGVKLAGALDAAHRRGIVHRDVKPQNVLVSPFVGPVLADFGIAALDPTRFTVTTEAFSVLHAAPEVLSGEPAGPAADLYSLASTLWELVVGRAPFADPEHPGMLPLLQRVTTGEILPMTRPGVPPAVERALRQLLARDPAARPPSAVALAQHLQSAQAAIGEPGSPLPLAPADASDRDAGAGHDPWAPPTGGRPAPLEATAPPPAAPSAVAPAPPDRTGLDTWAPPASAPAAPAAAAPAAAGPPAPVPGPAAVPGPSPFAPPAAEAYGPAPAPAREPERATPGAAPSPVPAASAGATARPVDVDASRDAPSATVARSRSAEPPPAPWSPPGERRRRWWIGGAAAVVVLAGIGGGLLLRGRSHHDDLAPARRRRATPTTTEPVGALPDCPAKTSDQVTSDVVDGRPPTHIDAAPVGDGTTARITWTDPNRKTATYFVIVRCAGAGTGQLVGIVGPGQKPAVSVDDLDVSENYCFSVGTVRADGSGQDLGKTANGKQFACLDDPHR